MKACQVLFGGAEVGVLAYTDDTPYASFEYSSEWLRDGFSISPLHLPLETGSFQFPALSIDTYKGLPAALSDSLPDDFGNAVINSWLARSGQDKSQFTAIDRLLYTGARGMGALEYHEPYHPFENQVDVQLEELLALSQQVLDTRNQLDVSPQESGSMLHLLQVGTSAGGARPKAVVAINQDRSRIVSGQVDAPAGFEHFILKLDGVRESHREEQAYGDPAGYGLIEYAYYRMAIDSGIEMMPSELLRENGRSHFLTRRFDRIHNQKYHMLTLCSMAHADYKRPGHFSYEELLATGRSINLSIVEQKEIFRRMVFNVVTRNQDDHTKNTTFLVDDDFRWRLAPAYDMTFSCKEDSKWVSQHQMSLNAKREKFTREDLLAVAQHISRFTTQQANRVIDEVVQVARKWPEYAEEVGVFPEWIDRIHKKFIIL